MRILVVEDDYLQADCLKELLISAFPDCHVDVIESERAFQRALPNLATSPDIAIIDLMLAWTTPEDMLPDCDRDEPPSSFRDAGMRCIELLRASQAMRSLPVIVYSVEEPELTIKDKNIHYLRKDVPDKFLLKTIRSILAANQKLSAKASRLADVFISYSHRDEKFLDELLVHLKPRLRTGQLHAWSDQQIRPGSRWLSEIKSALETSRVAVLLVSKDFLASDFVHEHELGPILRDADRGRVTILWVLVRACAYDLADLAKYQAAYPPDKPLAEMKAERDRAWVKICHEIEQALK